VTAPADEIRHSRRFVIQHPDRPDIHGIEFPSGRIIFDHPGIGLEAATSTDHIRDLTDGAAIHWADEDDGRP
jgi:hypothetical protein